MKIKAKITLVILGLTLTFSCNEWMDLIPPQGLVREEFWKTKEDVEAVVMGAYDTFSKMDKLLFFYGELRGDMVIGDSNLGGSEKQVTESTIYPNNGLCNWQDFYKVINYCNEIIKNAPLVQNRDNTFTDYQLNSYMAEAVFLRSLNYFYLIRIWKDVPYITEPTESDDTELYYSCSTDVEISEWILKDLEEYRKYATTDGYKTLEEIKGRATKAAFDALMADINLWNFNYEEVLRHVANVEANKEIQLVESDFFELFYPGNSVESIFEIQFNTLNSQKNSLYDLTNYINKNIDPSEKAINIFDKETGKEILRGEDVSIRKEGEDDYTIWKYVGRANDGETARSIIDQYSANFIIYRLADVILMKAEALSQLGNYGDAASIVQDLQNIRNAQDYDVPTNSRIALEDAIMDERARELAFEGKRWFDLMRMGRRDDYARKAKFIDIVVEDVPSAQKRILKTKLINPLGWYMPIHENELERNKNLEQNPYYNF